MKFSTSENEADADINLTPLIDVVFLLLIFFMVTTTFSREAEIKLKLPEATSQERDSSPEDNLITVQISDIGQFAVQGPEDEEARELISAKLDTLRRAIENAAGDRRDPIILIRADALAPHRDVVNVMDAARTLGFFQITFATAQ